MSTRDAAATTCSRTSPCAITICRICSWNWPNWDFPLGRLESNVLTSLQHVMGHIGERDVRKRRSLFPIRRRARALLAQRSRALLVGPRAGRSITDHGDAGCRSHSPERYPWRNCCWQGWISPVSIARMTHRPTGPKSSKRSDKPKIDSLQRGTGVGRRCRILVDLAGPKVRTGALEVENRPLKLSVPKDSEGRPSRLLEGYLDGDAGQSEWCESRVFYRISSSPSRGKRISADWRVGETLRFEDAGSGRVRCMCWSA